MDLTYAPPADLQARPTIATRYVGALGVCLLGYALLGKTFAYVGVAPVYIGEVMLAIGIGVALTMGRIGQAFSAWPLRLWALLLVWTLIRTVPYVAIEGIDAPRDAMVVVYGLYAVVVASVLLSEPERLRDLMAKYRSLAVVMLLLVGAVYGVTKLLGGGMPTLPWAPEVALLNAKGGDLMVQMTGIVAFLMLGGMRLSPWAVALAVFNVSVIMVSNRGGMVAFALGMGLVWLMRPSGTGATRFVYAMALLVIVAALVGPMIDIKIQGGTRSISIEQVVENVRSVFGNSGSNALDGTKRWRLLWWGKIVDYTFSGPYFWTGKGFGLNLAESDGFTLGEVDEGLRSPHNGHMTILARSGVPGLVLWTALHLSWFGMVLFAWGRARLQDHRRWMALFAWLAGFWVAALVNASFDVYLEGPMGGIWLWSVIGAGVAAVRLHRTRPELLDPLDLTLPRTSDVHNARSAAPSFSWF